MNDTTNEFKIDTTTLTVHDSSVESENSQSSDQSITHPPRGIRPFDARRRHTRALITMIAQQVSAKASYAAVSGLNKSRGVRTVRERKGSIDRDRA